MFPKTLIFRKIEDKRNCLNCAHSERAGDGWHYCMLKNRCCLGRNRWKKKTYPQADIGGSI